MGIFTSTQQGFKNTSSSLGLLLFRLFSALVVAYTASLIGQGLIFYGSIAFCFVLLTAALVFLKVTKGWGFLGILVLDLILFLVGLLLRMYVLVAPGA